MEAAWAVSANGGDSAMTIRSITFAAAIAVLSVSTAFAQKGGGGDSGTSGGGSSAVMALGVVPNNVNKAPRPVEEVRTDCGWQFYAQSGQRSAQKDCSRRIDR